jgi:hypothetical protein
MSGMATGVPGMGLGSFVHFFIREAAFCVLGIEFAPDCANGSGGTFVRECMASNRIARGDPG